MSVYVGIDVHRKRSQVAVVTEDGKVQLNRNVVNGQEPILRLIGDLPAGTPVAFEAAYGWGWLVELLEGYGFDPHLVHPLRCKAIASARLKNDKVDAAILAQLLRADLLPEAWIAPQPVRQLRAQLRHRASLGAEAPARWLPSACIAGCATSALAAGRPSPPHVPHTRFCRIARVDHTHIHALCGIFHRDLVAAVIGRVIWLLRALGR
jgi:hypothetical protein